MLHGKIFRSTVRARRASSASTPARHRRSPGVLPRRHHRGHPQGHSESVLRAGIPRPADPGADGKVRFVGEPVAVVLACDPHVAEEAVAADRRPNTKSCRRSYDEVEAMTSKAIVHDELKPAGTFPDLKHLKGDARHQRRARLPSAARRRRAGLRGGRRTSSSTRSAPSRCMHTAARAVRLDRRCATGTAHHPHRLAVPVVRAHRDRAAARLAGEPRAREGAVSSAAASAPSSTSSSRRW